MSLSTAIPQLQMTGRRLREAVDELVTMVHDGRPHASEVAIVEDLADLVADLQADVVEANEVLGSVSDVRQLPARMALIDAAIGRANQRYWKGLRGYTPVAELRRTARGRGEQWHKWQRTIEDSQQRCEEPLAEVTASVRLAWQEIGELLSFYLPSTATPSDTGAGAVRPHTLRRTP